MSNFVVEAESELRKKVEEMKDSLRELDIELKENRAKKTQELNAVLKELFDPIILERRYHELKQLQSTLRTLSDKAASIQLDVQVRLVPGVHLLVSPENQKAVASFVPSAYDTVVKTPVVLDALATLSEDSSVITSKMNKDLLAITQSTRQVASRVQCLEKERSDHDMLFLS